MNPLKWTITQTLVTLVTFLIAFLRSAGPVLLTSHLDYLLEIIFKKHYIRTCLIASSSDDLLIKQIFLWLKCLKFKVTSNEHLTIFFKKKLHFKYLFFHNVRNWIRVSKRLEYGLYKKLMIELWDHNLWIRT